MVPTFAFEVTCHSHVTLPSLGFFLLRTLVFLAAGAPLLQHDLILTLVTSETALPPGKVTLCGFEHHTPFLLEEVGHNSAYNTFPASLTKGLSASDGHSSAPAGNSLSCLPPTNIYQGIHRVQEHCQVLVPGSKQNS